MIININESPRIKQNSWKAIVKGARLETLPGAAVPVIIAIALAAGDMYRTGNIGSFQIIPAILCFLFAEIMQINANYINDYFDFKGGHDSAARQGNDRVATKGWMTMPFMRKVIIGTNIIAAAVGLPIIFLTPPDLPTGEGGPSGWLSSLPVEGLGEVFVGAACMLFSLLYTTLFSKKALGDVLVLLFFGIVPVCVTYYVLTGSCNWYVFVASLACGFEIDSMLVINNFRDHDEDLQTGKHTLSHILGRKRMLQFYLAIGFICAALGYYCYKMNGYSMAFNLQIIYLLVHMRIYNTMKAIWQGPELNKQLAANGKNILLYGLLIAGGILITFI